MTVSVPSLYASPQLYVYMYVTHVCPKHTLAILVVTVYNYDHLLITAVVVHVVVLGVPND